MRPLEEVARRIVLAVTAGQPAGQSKRALQAHWHAFDSALWANCRGGNVTAMVTADVLESVNKLKAFTPEQVEGVKAQDVVDEIIEDLEADYLPGDGLASRDAASGVYFRRYMPREGDVALDAGAHIGHVSLQLFSLVGVTGTVISIEPHPRNFGMLEYLFDDVDNVLVHPAALGAEVGEAFLSESLGSCSHRIVDKLGTVTHRVDVITVDSLNLPKLDFLKVDVEGFEWQLIQGAHETIKAHRPHIVLEFEGDAARDQITLRLEILGYVVTVEQTDPNVGMLWATHKEKL